MSVGYWLIGNCYGGLHVGYGNSATEAKADVRAIIAETFADQGLSRSACIQAAHSYHVRLVAGPLDHDVAWEARRAWDAEDFEPAMRLARPRVRRGFYGDAA